MNDAALRPGDCIHEQCMKRLRRFLNAVKPNAQNMGAESVLDRTSASVDEGPKYRDL